METKWYRADFDVVKDKKVINQVDEYYQAECDNDAIDAAHETAAYGIDYADIGHCNLELVQIVEVNESTECLDEIRVVYY